MALLSRSRGVPFLIIWIPVYCLLYLILNNSNPITKALPSFAGRGDFVFACCYDDTVCCTSKDISCVVWLTKRESCLKSERFYQN